MSLFGTWYCTFPLNLYPTTSQEGFSDTAIKIPKTSSIALSNHYLWTPLDAAQLCNGFLRLPSLSKSSSSTTHRCTGVSCCGCSRCRLAGRLWLSALWRKAGSRCCRSKSPVCRQSNQQRAHLHSLAHWAHHMTQLQTTRRWLSTLMFMRNTRCVLQRFAW